MAEWSDVSDAGYAEQELTNWLFTPDGGNLQPPTALFKPKALCYISQQLGSGAIELIIKVIVQQNGLANCTHAHIGSLQGSYALLNSVGNQTVMTPVIPF